MTNLPSGRYGQPGAVYGAIVYKKATPITIPETKYMIHVSLAFAGLPDPGLDSFAEQVDDNLFGKPLFSLPPVLQPAFQAALADFTTKIGLAATGGPLATAAKNTARQVLIGMLRQNANYVEGACNNNLETLLSSGYLAATGERHSLPLEQPVGLILSNGDPGSLVGKVKPVKNTKMYEGRASIDGGVTWLPSVFTSDSQHIIFIGLTPGVEYTASVRALGGSTGQSPWSDVTKHRAL